jgi:hypothetical protein
MQAPLFGFGQATSVVNMHRQPATANSRLFNAPLILIVAPGMHISL